MQQRRGTAQQWTDANPRLAAGEIGLETDTNKFKIGDDVNLWDDLAYFVNSDGLAGELDGFATEEYVDGAISSLIGDAPELLDTLNELAAAIGDDADFLTGIGESITAAQTAAEGYADGLAVNYDVAGAAAAAQTAAEDYADGLAVNYDVAGAAAAAQTAAEGYADGLAVNYDVAGAAAAAQTAAEDYADGLATNYDVAGAAAAAQTAAEDYADGLATNYEASGAVSTHSGLTTGVHGVTGDVVGTSDAQTLTNKTMGDDLLMNGFQVSGLGTPTQADHAATKSYVDSVAEGLHIHASVDVLADSNVSISDAAQVIDGVVAGVGSRILLVGQTNAEENGIYVRLPEVPSAPLSQFTSADQTGTNQSVTYSKGAYLLAGVTFSATTGSYVRLSGFNILTPAGTQDPQGSVNINGDWAINNGGGGFYFSYSTALNSIITSLDPSFVSNLGSGTIEIDLVAEPAYPLGRAEDYNTAAEIQAGDFVFVRLGTVYGSTGWVQENEVTTLGTSPIEWTQFSGAGTYLAGNGLNLDGNTFTIDETITATRTFASDEASAAQTAAESYADGLAVNYEVAGAAAAAQTAAEDYADGLAVNYDVAGAAAAAQTAAEDYADGLAVNYDVAGAAAAAQTAAEDYADSAISSLVASAPETLDTLNELAAALGDDANFATSTANLIGEKVAKSGDTMTGDLTLSGAPTSDLHAATKKYVDDEISGIDALPSQSGNTGKYLTTNGTSASWATVESSGGTANDDTILKAALFFGGN
jgi:hypothetical protein